MASKVSTAVYKSWSPLQREKFRKMKQLLAGELFTRMFAGKSILDIGCGSGFFQQEFPGTYVGLDIDEKMMSESKELFPRVLGDGNRLPFSDYSFDTVVSIDTMHLIKTKDFVRVLRPGGIVMLSVFFNDENYDERRQMLRDKVKDLVVVEEFATDTKEKEYVVVAMKPTFR